MKKLIWILPVLAIGLAACNTGDTPVEKYPEDPNAKPGVSSGAGAAGANVPPAAKDAMGAK